MTQVILEYEDVGDLDAQTLRRWAYDENLLLMEQDEDLILGCRDFLPILIPFADDVDCPKANYILSSLDFYLMFVVLQGVSTQVEAVYDAISLSKNPRTQELAAWAALQQSRLSYLNGIGETNRAMALRMGGDLLNGICRKGEISISFENNTTWEVQLSVPPFYRHKEWLNIDKSSGKFKFNRFASEFASDSK